MAPVNTRTWHAAVVAAATVWLLAGTAWAGPPDGTTRVEEDWVMVLGDISQGGPQVSTVMGPTSDLSQPVAVLDLNYQISPSYASGGLQMLIYDSTGVVTSQTIATAPLATSGETVSWTQRMSLREGYVQYSVPTLSSSTWGTLTNSWAFYVRASGLTSLSGYDPAASASNSGSAWKTQGVVSLTLTQVRYYSGVTLLGQDSTPRVVDLTLQFSRP
jgi:hypothetical protein